MNANTITSLEIIGDTIEPGSPVHDALYNLMSSLRKQVKDVTPEQAILLSKTIKAIKTFASLEDEHQWTLEDELSHNILAVTHDLTS